MQMKTFFVFLMAVALALPLATACSCPDLDGEAHEFCHYLKRRGIPQEERDGMVQDFINSKASYRGDFESIIDKPVEDTIQLNKLEEVDLKISEENKEFLIDFSSISLFGYIVYSFLKKYYLLLRLL